MPTFTACSPASLRLKNMRLPRKHKIVGLPSVVSTKVNVGETSSSFASLTMINAEPSIALSFRLAGKIGYDSYCREGCLHKEVKDLIFDEDVNQERSSDSLSPPVLKSFEESKAKKKCTVGNRNTPVTYSHMRTRKEKVIGRDNSPIKDVNIQTRNAVLIAGCCICSQRYECGCRSSCRSRYSQETVVLTSLCDDCESHKNELRNAFGD